MLTVSRDTQNSPWIRLCYKLYSTLAVAISTEVEICKLVSVISWVSDNCEQVSVSPIFYKKCWCRGWITCSSHSLEYNFVLIFLLVKCTTKFYLLITTMWYLHCHFALYIQSAGPDPHVPSNLGSDLSTRICRFYDYIPRVTNPDLYSQMWELFTCCQSIYYKIVICCD